MTASTNRLSTLSHPQQIEGSTNCSRDASNEQPISHPTTTITSQNERPNFTSHQQVATLNVQRITLIFLTVSPAKAAYNSTPQLEVQRSMQTRRAPLQWQGIVREPKSSPDRRRIWGYISPSTLALILISQPPLTTTTNHSPSPLPSNNTSGNWWIPHLGVRASRGHASCSGE